MDTNEELQERYNTIDDRMPSIQIRVLQTLPAKNRAGRTLQTRTTPFHFHTARFAINNRIRQ